MLVTTQWNQEHDEAVIFWDYKNSHEVPTDAINNVLAGFYNQDLFPWFFVVADSMFNPLGLLATECDSLEQPEVKAIFDSIVQFNSDITVEGDWSVRTYVV